MLLEIIINSQLFIGLKIMRFLTRNWEVPKLLLQSMGHALHVYINVFNHALERAALHRMKWSTYGCYLRGARI